MREESQHALLQHLAAEPTLQSIVAASFDESESVFKTATDGVVFKLIQWEGKLLRPLPESEPLGFVDLAIVMPISGEVELFLERLRSLARESSPVWLADLEVADMLGAVSSEKIITASLCFPLNLNAGILGNILYTVLQVNPSAQCVVGDTALSKDDIKDKAALEAKLLAAAKPMINKN